MSKSHTVIIQIESKEQLERILQEAKSKSGPDAIVVIDFYATWCHPCNEISPLFKDLSTQFSRMKFLKVDVDQHEDIAQDYNVRSLPTFVFCRGTVQIDRVLGAQPQHLRAKLMALGQPSGASATTSNEPVDSSKGSSLKQFDLDSLLSKTQCECLNEDDTHSLSLLWDSNAKSYLLSDTDEQLIIYVTFSQFIRLQGIQINGPKDSGPKTVKLFINQTSTPDFDSCEAGEAVQTLELTEDDLKEDAITQLNFVKFQNVNTITLFIKDNQSSTDQTRIDKLKFYGYPVNTINMNEFKRVAGKKGEAHG